MYHKNIQISICDAKKKISHKKVYHVYLNLLNETNLFFPKLYSLSRHFCVIFSNFKTAINYCFQKKLNHLINHLSISLTILFYLHSSQVPRGIPWTRHGKTILSVLKLWLILRIKN